MRRTGIQRNTPIHRGTRGLASGKPLKRVTPLRGTSKKLARTTELKRTTRSEVASRPLVTADERSARALVKARSHGLCEVQIPGVCFLVAGNFHHRQNKSQLGIWSAPNGLAVCGSGSTGCHGALTNTNGRRREYERAGWIVPSTKDPADVPVDHARLGRVFLLDNGDTKPAPKRKKAAA